MSEPKSFNEMSLDELFAVARRQAARNDAEEKRLAKAKPKRLADKTDKEDAPVTPQVLFLDPQNWERTRGIALIHADTETLLGNFSEYLHRSVPNCRKLVREDSPIAVTATERVSGGWWLGQHRTFEKPKPWHFTRPAIIHLHLSELRVHSPAAEVTVFLSYGSITRVELAADTLFAPEGEGGEYLLTLPKGTNILEVMSRDCKISLREQVAS